MTDPTTVLCPSCGTRSAGGTHFCASCGAELPSSPTEAPQATEVGTSVTPPPTETMQTTPPAGPDYGTEGDLPPAAPPPPSAPMSEPQGDDESDRTWWIIGGIVAAVVLLIGGIAAFMLLGDDDTVTTDEVAVEQGTVDTSVPESTEVPPTSGDSTPERTPTTESQATTSAPRRAPTTDSPTVTTVARSAPTVTDAPAPTDRSEEAAGLIGSAIDECGGIGFVDTIVGSPTGDDSVYTVKARFVWDDSEPFTASYTVNVDSEVITPGDSESAYLICR